MNSDVFNYLYKMICSTLLVLLFLAACNTRTDNKMKTEIEKMFASQKGTFALAFSTIEEEPKSIFINELEVFHAASTMKTPVMIEAYRQAAEGTFNLDDSLLIKNEFKSIVDGSFYSLDFGRDSGEKLYSQIGKKYKIHDLIYDMIINSSNLATNLIIEHLDAKRITQTMRNLGADKIEVLRGVEDMKAYDAGLNNTTTAYDLFKIYEALAKGQVISQEASQEMIEILLDQKHNDIIPAKLPQGVKVAHKTGWISGIQHDSGIVILEDGRQYILVLLSKELENIKNAKHLLADVSLRLYDFVTKY